MAGLSYVQKMHAVLTTWKLTIEKGGKYYIFWRQLNEKPSIIPDCPWKKLNIYFSLGMSLIENEKGVAYSYLFYAVLTTRKFQTCACL